MEGFTYNNIFETKGIEYLAILAFFAILIPFWLILNKQVRLTKQLQKQLGNLSANNLRIPQGLFFSKYHTWTHLEKSGIAKVGLDDLLLHLTGNVRLELFKIIGDHVKKDELLAQISHEGKKLQILSPITGILTESNPALKKSPEFLNEDPFGRGWMCKIKPTNWVADTSTCFLAEDASAWSTRELDRFKDFLSASLHKYSPDSSNMILQDGGELRDEPLAELPEEVWNDFQHDFLKKKQTVRVKKCWKEEINRS